MFVLMNLGPWLVVITTLTLSPIFCQDTYLINIPTALLSDAKYQFFMYVSTNVALVIETVHPASQITHRSEVKVLKKGTDLITYYVPFIGPHLGSSLQLRFRGDKCIDDANCKMVSNPIGNFILEHRQIEILSNNFIILSETDKPIYKPGDMVKFRIMAIYPVNLMLEPSSNGPFTEILLVNNTFTTKPTIKRSTLNFYSVTIENPNNVKMAQWLNVSFIEGMQLSFPIPKDPEFGQWKLTSIFKSQKEDTFFKVEKFVLPRFQMSLHPPPTFLVSDSTITFNVCASYSTGKNIQALIKGEVCVLFVRQRTCREYTSKLNGSNKCANITMYVSSFGLGRKRLRYSSPEFTFIATVTESGTTHAITRTVKGLKIINVNYEIKMLSKKYFKPSLSYFGRIKLQRHGGIPQRQTKVIVRIDTAKENRPIFEQNCTSNNDGIVVFVVPSTPVASKLNLRVTGEKETTVTSLKTPRLDASLFTWESEDNEYIQILPLQPLISCPNLVTFKLQSNRDFTNYYLYTQILSGGITHRSFNSQFISTTIKRINSNLVLFETDLVIPLIDVIGPDVHVITYYMNRGNEVIADSLEIESFKNCPQFPDGRFEFSKQTVNPGEAVQLFLSSGTRTRNCGLKISDSTMTQFGTNGNINLDYLFNKLIQINHRITRLGSMGRRRDTCISVKRNGNYYYTLPGLYPTYDSMRSFAESGYTPITNTRVKNVKCHRRKYNFFFYNKIRRITEAFTIPPNASFLGRRLQHRQLQHRELRRRQLWRRKRLYRKRTKKIMTEKAKEIKNQIRDFFPETWIFNYYNHTPSQFNMTVPHSLTRWEASAFCMTERGIWIPSSSYLTVALPFYADIYLPYSIKMGENLILPVKLFNYIPDCYQIIAEIAVNLTDIEVSGAKSIKVCICSNNVKTLYFNLTAKVIGKLNITITTKSEYSNLCSNTSKHNQNVNLFDSIRRQLFVEPHGVPTESTFSEFICNSNNKPIITRGSLHIPPKIISGSLRSYLVYNGDVMGQTFDNLDRLVRMPYGCGEQNMVAIVPSIYVLDYLTNMRIENPALVKKAKGYIIDGYRRQLNYKHPDGSYSAFGKNDKSGNTWLTAFVLRSFYDASKYVSIDKDILTESLRYLKNMQSSDGCFREKGRLLSGTMAGGVTNKGETDNVLLTAYVLISVKNIQGINTFFDLSKSVNCVTSGLRQNASSYRLALCGYALTLHDKQSLFTLFILNKLQNLAISIGKYKYWKSGLDWPRTQGPINAGDIETSGYALLALQNNQPLFQSLRTVYWLSNQRNSLGGYFSTQDTIVALNAIAVVAQRIGATKFRQINLEIILDETHRQRDILFDSNRLVTRKVNVGSQRISNIFIRLNGTGCVFVQLISLYNIPSLFSAKDEFRIDVKTAFADVMVCTKVNLNVCSSYLRKDRNTNMILITIAFPSGWELSDAEKNVLLTKLVGPLKRIDFTNNNMYLYYDSFSYDDNKSNERCISFSLDQTSKVNHLKPSIIRIVDYYKPEIYTDLEYDLPLHMCRRAI